MIGKKPVTKIAINGRQVNALVDTGSQVSTITSSWARENLNTAVKDASYLKLKAANGLPIPYDGIMIVNVKLFGETFLEVPFLVLPKSHNDDIPCLLGTNLLAKCMTLPETIGKLMKNETLNHKAFVARVSVKHQIPPCSVSTIQVNCPGKMTKTEVLMMATPLSYSPPKGLLLIPTVVLTGGNIYLRVANLSPEHVILQPRTAIANLEAVESVEEEQLELTISSNEVHVEIKNSHTQPKETLQSPTEKIAQTSPSSCTQKQRRQIDDLIDEYQHIFARDDSDLGYCDITKHKIPTVDAIPVSQPYRRIAPTMLQEVREHLQKLKDANVIVESHSPYASPVVLVRKKDGSLRMCVDYRRLNAKTINDAFPLPRIQESFDALAGARFFSSIDFASGYHQIAMDPNDQSKTAFTTPFGLFEYTRMPFGLTSAPATFQRLMQRVMSDFLFEHMLVYLDDLLVYSKTFEEHLTHLRRLFQRIQTTGLKLRLDKCQFLPERVTYLGHTISSEGIACEDEKVQKVIDWPVPKTVKELRSFLGFASYYRRFVKGFAKIAAPLHDLVTSANQENKKCRQVRIENAWQRPHQEAFLALKDAITTAPTLGFADFSKDFIVQTDASQEGLGCILSQKQDDGTTKPIAFASRRLRPTEKNYYDSHHSSYKLEFLAMKWAIADKFRHYLISNRFVALTDNNALTYYKTAKLGAIEQ